MVAGLGVLASACTSQVSGTASPASAPAGGPARTTLPGGAELSCLTSCEDGQETGSRDSGAGALAEVVTLPPGLFCRDLAALGYGPRDAVEYWFYWGEPAQMDADLNGIPCETVWAGMEGYMPG